MLASQQVNLNRAFCVDGQKCYQNGRMEAKQSMRFVLNENGAFGKSISLVYGNGVRTDWFQHCKSGGLPG